MATDVHETIGGEEVTETREGDFKGKKDSVFRRLRTDFHFISGNFRIMLLSWLALDFFSELPRTYYPLYVVELGGTTAIIGLIGAAEQFARALTQIPGGYMADRYGRKWLIVVMTIISALSHLIYAFALDWRWLLLGAVIFGVTGIYRPALDAIVADSVPEDKRGMGFSLINLIASVSTTPAPLLSGYLLVRMGLVPSVRVSYLLVVLGFLIAAAFRFRLKETIENPHPVNVKEMVGTYPVSFRESLHVWKLVPRSAFVLFVVNVIVSFAIGLFQPILTLWIIEDLGISAVAFSYIMASMFITMIVLAIPAGKMIDKIGKKKPLIGSFILWWITVLLVFTGDFVRLIIAMSLVGLLQVMISSATSALSADLIPKEHRGKTNGSRGFFSMIGGSIGMMMGGWLYDNISHSVTWYLQLLVIIIPFTLVSLYVKEPPKIGDR